MASKVLVSAATGIAGIALVLQVVGFALPGWFVINHGEFFVGIGLWNVEYCLQNVCTSITMEQVLAETGKELEFDSFLWREFQTEATLSIIGAFLSVGVLTARTLMICVVKGNNWNNINVLSYIGACTSIGSVWHPEDKHGALGTININIPFAILKTGTLETIGIPCYVIHKFNINMALWLLVSILLADALLGFIVVGRMAYVIFLVMDVSTLLSAPYALIIFGVGSLVSLCVFWMELTLPRMLRKEAHPRYTNFQNALM